MKRRPKGLRNLRRGALVGRSYFYLLSQRGAIPQRELAKAMNVRSEEIWRALNGAHSLFEKSGKLNRPFWTAKPMALADTILADLKADARLSETDEDLLRGWLCGPYVEWRRESGGLLTELVGDRKLPAETLDDWRRDIGEWIVVAWTRRLAIGRLMRAGLPESEAERAVGRPHPHDSDLRLLRALVTTAGSADRLDPRARAALRSGLRKSERAFRAADHSVAALPKELAEKVLDSLAFDSVPSRIPRGRLMMAAIEDILAGNGP